MTLTFLVSNTTTATIAFYLEPWGGRYQVAPDHALRVVIESSAIPVLEWELANDTHSLVVRHPTGATAIVYDGDTEMRAE